MKWDDHFVTNIFIDPSNQYPSLVSLRILNALYSSRKQNRNNVDITKEALTDHLCIFDQLQQRNRADGYLSMLRSKEKRLLFVPSFTNGRDDNSDAEPKINISLTGELYLEYLCKDLQYIQSCFEIIDWNSTVEGNINSAIRYVKERASSNKMSTILIQSLSDFAEGARNIPDEVDNDNLHEIFKFLRTGLRFLFNKDVIETINYKLAYERNGNVRNFFMIDSLIMAPVIVRAADSIFNIAKYYISQNRNVFTDLLNEEIKQWRDLILMLHEWTVLLFPNSAHIKLIKDTLIKIDNHPLFKDNNS
jgi:hypothetical protein